MSRAVDDWQQVADDAPLMARAAAVDASDVSAVARLRRDYSATQVAVALELAAARRKAASKFGERAATLVADVPGVEQASGASVAAYKARRLAEATDQGAVVDVCCGIGGDAMALCEAGLDVLAVDHDALRLWMAQTNVGGGVRGRCVDVSDARFEGAAMHIDPARRDESAGRRVWRLADMRPGPAVIGRLVQEASLAAVKLSPGVDLDELAEALPGGEVEFISSGGRLVQAVLWTGAPAGAARRATLLIDGEAHTLAGEPGPTGLGGAGRYVFAVDPSVERAGLLGALCERVDAPMLHPRLGLLTSDRVIDSPWLTGFELIERMPWRPRRVAQWLAANDGGLVEVKTRGKACDPDREQRRLRGEGGTTYTIFVLRFETKVEALVTRRL